jgi:hypothetical protein
VQSFFLPSGLPLLAALPLRAQKRYVEEKQFWLGVLNQTRFSKHCGSLADLHLRLHDNFVSTLYQGVARVELAYHLTDDVRLAAGYTSAYLFADGARTVGQPEHRPWQQAQWSSTFPKARLTQRVRLEERFRQRVGNNEELATDYNSNYRARYSVALFLPLSKNAFESGGLQLLLQKEVMANFDQEIICNYFDQNRLFAGLVYQVSKQVQAQGGYMHLFQQLPAGNVYHNQHSIRVFYSHNLNLRPSAAPVSH